MSHRQKRSKGWASKHPELVAEEELKLNDSNADEDEVLDIINAHCELVKAMS